MKRKRCPNKYIVDGMTIDQISEKCGISKQTLYARLKSGTTDISKLTHKGILPHKKYSISKNRYVIINGERISLIVACEKYNANYRSILKAMQRGKDNEYIIDKYFNETQG